MQDRDGVAEARPEARDDLRRQRDLGHEHDRRRGPRASAALGGAQVDLGLARAGDAVQQQPLAGRGARAIVVERGRAGRRSAPAAARRRGADRGVLAARGARRAARSSRGRGASRRRSAAVSAPVKRGSEASSARWRVRQALAVAPARRAGPAYSAVRRPRRPSAAASATARAPASSSTRPRSTARARRDPAGSEASSTRRGATTLVLGRRSATAVTTPRTSRPPNGTTSTEPTPTPSGRSVVERPAQDASRRDRLDPRDTRHAVEGRSRRRR